METKTEKTASDGSSTISTKPKPGSTLVVYKDKSGKTTKELETDKIGNTITSLPDASGGWTRKAVLLNDSRNRRLDEKAFRGKELTELSIPSRVTKIGNGTFENNKLKSLTIPSTVKVIDAGAFVDNQLSSLTIEDGVELIGSHAFRRNQLVSLVIPPSVDNLMSNAFANNQLVEVILQASCT